MCAKRTHVDFGAAMSSSLQNIASSNSVVGILNDASNQQREGEVVQKIHVSRIAENELNKKIYDMADLTPLAKDIAERGIQQPLLVRQRTDGKYVIISGHRRFASNDIARNQYDYKDGEYVPCLVKADVKDSITERESLILDNLQRDKSDFNRMMEVMQIKECAEERRMRGEDVPYIRDYISAKIGISLSDIQRYYVIADKLNSEFMNMYREQSIATNVAYELARLSEEKQSFVYIMWKSDDKQETLTLPLVNRYLSGMQQGEENEKPAEKTPKPVYKYKTLEQGTSDIKKSMDDVLKAISDRELDKSTTKRILKRAGKVRAELESILVELQASTQQ